MTYREQLYPWCIIRQSPASEPHSELIVARFRRRNNAEDHLQSLQRLMPGTSYQIVFAPNAGGFPEAGDEPQSPQNASDEMPPLANVTTTQV